MAAPCKFDRKCHRADCYFSHPNGRECDDGPAAPAGHASAPAGGASRAPTSSVPCKFDFLCKRADCYFFHPSGRAIELGGGGGGAARLNPSLGDESINLPDSPFGGAEEAEFEAMLEEQEAAAAKDTWYPAHRNCSCCKGYVHACTAAMCAELGICGCTLEDSDIQAAGDAEA